MKGIDTNCEGHVNKSLQLNNISVSRHIDRIQFTVRNYFDLFTQVEAAFKQNFTYLRVFKVKNKPRLVTQFNHGKSTLELVRYANKKLIFSISVSEPDETIQVLIRDILIRITASIDEKYRPCAWLKESEFAVDIFPRDPTHLYDLWRILFQTLVTRYMRADSCHIIGFHPLVSTMYQGCNGNVRRGIKGIRVYFPRGECHLRLELQVNRYFFWKHNIGLFDLPMSPDRVDLFDYVDFRHGINDVTLQKLIRILRRRHWPMAKPTKGADCYTSMRERVTQRVLRNYICSNISKYGESDPVPDEMIPVSQQIAFLKKMGKKHKFTSPVDRFFPKNTALLDRLKSLI